MTEHQGTVFAPEVHAVSFAEGEGFAVLTGCGLFHPSAVSIGFKTMFPYLPERITIDVSLVVFAADGRASRDRAVDEDGSDRDACGTVVKMVTYTSFVGTEVAFAGIGDMPSGFTLGDDEVHEGAELGVREEEFGVGGGSTHGINAEDSPIAHAE